MDSCPAWHQSSLIQPLAQLRKGAPDAVWEVVNAIGRETSRSGAVVANGMESDLTDSPSTGPPLSAQI